MPKTLFLSDLCWWTIVRMCEATLQDMVIFATTKICAIMLDIWTVATVQTPPYNRNMRYCSKPKISKYKPSSKGDSLTTCNNAPPAKSKMTATGLQNGWWGLEGGLTIGGPNKSCWLFLSPQMKFFRHYGAAGCEWVPSLLLGWYFENITPHQSSLALPQYPVLIELQTVRCC